MPPIPTSKFFAGLDVDEVCRNWRTSSSGAEFAMGNRFAAVEMLANALNHAAARQIRRVQFQMYLHPDFANASDSDPLYIWNFDDLVDDGENVVWRILVKTRESGSGDCYAGRQATPSTDRTQNVATTRSFNYPEDLLEVDFTFNRGVPGGTDVDTGLSTFNNFAVIDVVVSDQPIITLNTATHTNYIDAVGKPGDDILANFIEDIRAAFHQLRITNLPILSSWCAPGRSGGHTPSVAAPAFGSVDGDQYGFRSYSTTSTNILDLASTSRTATTAGIPCFVKASGIGRVAIAKGYKLKVQCRVLARRYVRESTGDQQVPVVTFTGPLGSTTINVTNDATAWQGTSSNFIDLDTSQDDDEASSTTNKVDIFAKGDRGLVDEVFEGSECQVMGWMMWVDYNSYW